MPYSGLLTPVSVLLLLILRAELSGGNVRIGKMQLLASGKVRLVTVDGDVYEVRKHGLIL